MNETQGMRWDDPQLDAVIKDMKDARDSLIEMGTGLARVWRQLGKAIESFSDVKITGESWQIGDHELDPSCFDEFGELEVEE